MKIGHVSINFKKNELTDEESFALLKATKGKFKSLQDIKSAEDWHFCRIHLTKIMTAWIGCNQANHPMCFEMRSILFKMHDWNPSEWKRYAGLTKHHEGLNDLWMMPCDELHKLMMSVLNKKALRLKTLGT